MVEVKSVKVMIFFEVGHAEKRHEALMTLDDIL